MNKMRVKCIICQKEWEKTSSISWGPDDISSSLCASCFRGVASRVIHKKQLKEGYFDCFAKADEYCDQSGCKYRQWCLDVKAA